MSAEKKQLPEDVIPEGIYCHGPLVRDGETSFGLPILKSPHRCPYWKHIEGKPEQENGYCEYLGLGDGDKHPSKINGLGEPYEIFLLWDQVKQCGIKDDPCEEDFQ